jgi:hypothetical protein
LRSIIPVSGYPNCSTTGAVTGQTQHPGDPIPSMRKRDLQWIGCSSSILRPALAQGLEAASPEQLASVEILGRGYGLNREDLSIDLSLIGLMAGMFGTRASMARHGGKSTSPAKADALLTSGTQCGRPKKTGNQ